MTFWSLHLHLVPLIENSFKILFTFIKISHASQPNVEYPLVNIIFLKRTWKILFFQFHRQPDDAQEQLPALRDLQDSLAPRHRL